ncbi:MAG: ABC transporter ATP-binding protein [Eubacteriales bacterium]|nr:ABC transporter ATP-binding protein [Eubacteriales bacterium]
MINIEELSKEYKKPYKKVLDQISFQIREGEMVAIMGKSGAGKSTLLNILGCIDTATGGKYVFHDVDVTGLSKKELHQFRKKHFSYIFQNFELLPEYSVYENIEIPLLARNVKNRKTIILNALEEVGIAEHRRKKIHKLSGGEQQRCAIARAIVADTDVILADEPTGSLDENTADEIMQLLKRLNDQGKTIIIVTHDRDIAAQCQRSIIIKDGKIWNGETV